MVGGWRSGDLEMIVCISVLAGDLEIWISGDVYAVCVLAGDLEICRCWCSMCEGSFMVA